MARIHIGGAGGAPSNNFIRSMRDSARGHYLIGASSVLADLMLADVDEKHVVPNAVEPSYPTHILALLARHAQLSCTSRATTKVRAVSHLRDEICALGIRLFLPSVDTIENCIDKGKSYRIWAAAGLQVPATILLHTPDDLKGAFDALATPSGFVQRKVEVAAAHYRPRVSNFRRRGLTNIADGAASPLLKCSPIAP